MKHQNEQNNRMNIYNFLLTKWKEKEVKYNLLFYQALTDDHCDESRQYLARANVGETNTREPTALHVVVIFDKDRICDFLLRHDADMHDKDICGDTPIQLALNYGRSEWKKDALKWSL